MKQSHEIKLQDVTLVTGNDRRTLLPLVEVAIYVAVLWGITHPDQVERAKDRLIDRVEKLRHRVSVWQAHIAIQALPETDKDER